MRSVAERPVSRFVFRVVSRVSRALCSPLPLRLCVRQSEDEDDDEDEDDWADMSVPTGGRGDAGEARKRAEARTPNG